MLRPTCLVLIAIVSLAFPSEGHATHPAACPDGVYGVEGPPLLPGSATDVQDTIVIDHGTVAIASGCPATIASIRPLRRGGWRVRAVWRECGGLARRVRLQAHIAAGCGEMKGLFAATRPRTYRKFVARECTDQNVCPKICRSNDECPASAWCAKRAGDCDGSGMCRPSPTACPDVWDPVCGCDGVTYGNACDAAAAGVNVRRPGRCDARCDVTHPCDARQFCELPAGVCTSGLDAGMCVEVPNACPDVYRPVCGCDGRTYGNDCDRRTNQISKSRDGRCACPAILCAPGTLPFDRDGDGCDDECRAPCRTSCDCNANPHLPFPEPCPLLCPTCGNYWACEKGFCVEQCGPMPPDDCRRCGGIAGIPCPRGETCDLPAGECLSADLEGTCVEQGDACMTLWDPVCGCDGRTYGNDCERVRAGIQKAHDGPCSDARAG